MNSHNSPFTPETFVRLMAEGGFSREQTTYWLIKLLHNEWNEELHARFQEELQERLREIRSAIAVAEAQIEEKKAFLREQHDALLPFLEEMYRLQPEAEEKELAKLKKELSDTEKQMMHDLEKVRHEGEDSAIAKLRRKLSGNG